MNPQQPMQGSDVGSQPEQPFADGQQVVAPIAGQPNSADQSAAQTTPAQGVVGGATAVAVSPTPEVAAPAQPMAPLAPLPQSATAAPVMTQPIAPSPGMAPSSPGIPTAQPAFEPTTGQGYVGGGGFDSSQIPKPINSGKKNRIIKSAIIAAFTVLILGIGVFGFMSWKGGQISLTSYEGDGFSVLVPEGYKELEEAGITYFKEDTEDKESTSAVAFAQKGFGAELSVEQFKQFKSIYTKTEVKNLLEEYEGESGGVLTDVDINTKESDTSLTYYGTADIENDGEIVAKMYYNYTFTQTGASLVMVVAHKSDPALEKNAQKIIDSMKVE